MLIKKSFRIVLSGAYQSFEFQTSLDHEFDVNPDDTKAVQKASDTLLSLAIDLVEQDIENYKMKDDKFKVVMDVRADQLAKAAKIVK